MGYCPGPCSTSRFFFGIFMFDTLPKQDLRDRVGWYRSFIEPVLYSFNIERNLFGFIFFDGVVVAQLFEDSAVTRPPRFDGVDSKKRPMPPANPRHS